MVKVNNKIKISQNNLLISNNLLESNFNYTYKDAQQNAVMNELSASEIYQKYQDEFKKANVLINGSKNILKFDMITNVHVNHLNFAEEYFELKLEQYDADHKLFIVKREREANPFNHKSYVTKEMDNATQSIKVPYNELVFDWLKEGDNLDVLVGSNLNTAHFVEINDNCNIHSKYISLSNEFDGKFYVNGRKALSIYIKKKD